MRISLLIGTAISLYFVPWPIVIAWMRPLPATVQEQVKKVSDYGFDGVIVYVDKKGCAPKLYAGGYHNRDDMSPANPSSLFKIASVGKLYQAVAISKLVRAGKLSLNGTLASYLPELAGRIEYADKITIEMLVKHISGIPNYTDTKNYWLAPKIAADENLALVLDMPAQFKPGERYQYCNTNYLLLDKIMARVLGYDTFQYIQEVILNPLGLVHTYASIDDVDLETVMSGYYVGYDRDLKADHVGSMLATAEDVGLFIRALNDGTVFIDAEEQRIYASMYEFGHTGLVPGYQTIAKYHQALDAVVIQFTNTVDFEGYNWSLSEILYGKILKILKRQGACND
ncbi:MAG: serine hydrolase domain-containing protein [Saprospiraceae bacterium]